MRAKIALGVASIVLVLGLLIAPNLARAQAQPAGSGDDAVFYAGSFLFSLFYLPIKLVTCIGTQVLADTAYIATYQVPGNYDGGTNGKDIGQIVRGACTTPWVITPDQVKTDYQ